MSDFEKEIGLLPIDRLIREKADISRNCVSFEGVRGIAHIAYMAGRTAEPTGAEIEAAAQELFERRVYNQWGEEPRKPWSEQRNSAKEMWRKEARWALMAARKAVTE